MRTLKARKSGLGEPNRTLGESNGVLEAGKSGLGEPIRILGKSNEVLEESINMQKDSKPVL